jgi:hypothetical protein
VEGIDAGMPRLYRSESLKIRGAGGTLMSLLAAGEYHDPYGLRVGRFTVTAPPRNRWQGRRAIAVTEIADGDGLTFMLVRREPFQIGRNRGGRYVLTDVDGTEVGMLRPRPSFSIVPLHVKVSMPGHGTGELRESGRRARGVRTFEVRVRSDKRPVGTIDARQGPDDPAEISLVHAADSPPPWRCATLALATCLPQFGVGVAGIPSGSGP